MKSGAKEKEEGEEHNGTKGGVQGEKGSFIQNVSLLLIVKKRAKEKLLLASWTQCQTQSVSSPAVLLVSQAPAHNGGEPRPATPLTSNLHPPGQAWEPQGPTTMHLRCSTSHEKSV